MTATIHHKSDLLHTCGVLQFADIATAVWRNTAGFEPVHNTGEVNGGSNAGALGLRLEWVVIDLPESDGGDVVDIPMVVLSDEGD